MIRRTWTGLVALSLAACSGDARNEAEVATVANAIEASPCPDVPPEGIWDGVSVDLADFESSIQTKEKHFTIHYGHQFQQQTWGSVTCFPEIWKVDNERKFAENVGAIFEQVYSFYANEYATGPLLGPGFPLPPHIDIKLYNAPKSVAANTTIRAEVDRMFKELDGTWRFMPDVPVHELFHIVQAAAGAPGAQSPLLDWFQEGAARYTDTYLQSKDDGSGSFDTSFGDDPADEAFWDLAQTQELGSYHFGNRFWRFLTHRFPKIGVSAADRDNDTHTIALPHDTGVTPPAIYHLKPRRGIRFLQAMVEELQALDAAGACPTGDECLRQAVDQAFARGTWAATNSHLYTFDKAYRAYVAENVRLAGFDELYPRFGGKSRSKGFAPASPVQTALISSYQFETGTFGHYTVQVTATARSGSQTPSGDDDDLRFELNGVSFGDWNSPAAFNGTVVSGRTETRFLSTAAVSKGLGAGSHVFEVYGDEQPGEKRVRVVRGDIAPIHSAENLQLVTGTGSCSAFGGNYTLGHSFSYPGPAPFQGQVLLANATLDPATLYTTGFASNGVAQQYTGTAGTPTYKTDTPLVFQGNRAGGVAESLRFFVPGAAGTNQLEICSRPRAYDADGDGDADDFVSSHTIDSLYLLPRATHDVFLAVRGSVHEYSAQYERFDLDGTADSVEITLQAGLPGSFLVVYGVDLLGQKFLISSDVWDPTAAPQSSYTVSNPAQYEHLVVGVGAHSIEPFSTALVDITQRATTGYTLRIVSRY